MCADRRPGDPTDHRPLDRDRVVRSYVPPIPVRGSYYLAKCEVCGWLGSTEQCSTDAGDDSEVFCASCGSSGVDCGQVDKDDEARHAEAVHYQIRHLREMLELKTIECSAWKRAAVWVGVCSSCGAGSYEPCTDCLGTGWGRGDEPGALLQEERERSRILEVRLAKATEEYVDEKGGVWKPVPAWQYFAMARRRHTSPPMLECAFCGEGDFDHTGLKLHYTRGYCRPYECVEVGGPDGGF